MVRESTQQYSVDDTKNRGVCPNSQRQSDYRHDRKQRLLGQHAECVAQVLSQYLHLVFSSGTDFSLCPPCRRWPPKNKSQTEVCATLLVTQCHQRIDPGRSPG